MAFQGIGREWTSRGATNRALTFSPASRTALRSFAARAALLVWIVSSIVSSGHALKHIAGRFDAIALAAPALPAGNGLASHPASCPVCLHTSLAMLLPAGGPSLNVGLTDIARVPDADTPTRILPETASPRGPPLFAQA